MKVSEPLVYIILLVWNNYEDTIECVESLKKIDYKNYKIVIVDNGSTTEAPYILQAKYPQHIHIRNEKNLGFAGGCNIGIKYAMNSGANYVLLLNNDTVVEKQFLSVLVRVGENDCNIGLLSSYIYFASDPDKIWSSGMNFRIDAWPFNDKYKNASKYQMTEETRKVDFLSGCSLFIKSEVIKKVGLLEEKYFMYFEDMDYCMRVKKSNYELVAVRDSKVWHKVGATSSKDGEQKIRKYFARNMQLFISANFTLEVRARLGAKILFMNIVEIIKVIRTNNLELGKAIFIGYTSGLLGKTGRIK